MKYKSFLFSSRSAKKVLNYTHLLNILFIDIIETAKLAAMQGLIFFAEIGPRLRYVLYIFFETSVEKFYQRNMYFFFPFLSLSLFKFFLSIAALDFLSYFNGTSYVCTH